MKVPWVLVVTFALLAVAVGVGGYLYYLHQERSILADRQEDILAIAGLKVDQLVHWRRERLGDAAFIFGSPDLAQELESYLASPSDKAREARVLRWFELLKDQNGYRNILFADLSGAVKLSAVPLASGSRQVSSETLEAIRKGLPALTDLHREASGGFGLDVVAPILGRGSAPIGAVLLTIDPTRYLFPLIETWPTPSPTSETLLVERRGERVVYLNHLRHRSNEPFLFSLPLSSPDLLSAEALRGREGVISGVDYRGVPVVGAARRVPDTPWYLVAETDRSEVQAPIRSRAGWTILVSTLLILCAGVTVILIWRQQQVGFYRQQYEEETRHREIVGRAEAELRRANRALRMLTDCNEALIRETQEQQLLDELCRIVVEVGGYSLAWVGMAGSDDHKLVRPVAKVGFDNGYLATAEVTWADEPRGRGPTGTAIRTGRAVTVKGTDEAEPATFVEAIEAIGCAAGVALPLRVEGNVIGAITIYSMEPDSFNPDEMRTLNELAEDLSFGIQVLRGRAAQKAAEEALRESQRLESVGRLAGGMAHDFNNYLTVINGYCDVLLDSMPEDNPIKEQIAEIRASGGRAAQLTERLLAFSRRQVLDLKPCSLNDITTGLESTLRQVAGAGIDVALGLAPDLWLTMADPVQVERVLMNLVANARDAIKSGGRISIRTSNATMDGGAVPPGTAAHHGDYVVLAVTDTGTGMDEATRSHLFEPFFTTKNPGHGTGLGLATVYGIVTQSGGWISVRSKPGQGATFEVYFPRRVA